MSFKPTLFMETATAEPATQVQETKTEETPTMSPAEAMAKHGVKNSSSDMVAKPIEVTKPTEKKEETKATTEATPAATATEPEKVEEVKSEPPAAKEEPKAEVPDPKKSEAPAKVPTLQEVLKSEQPNTILKALGVDDKVINLLGDLKGVDPKVVGILEAYKEGKLGDYIKALGTDYSKMSSEEVMRHQLRQEYPKASDKQLDILFKKEVTNAYNLDSEDPEEKEEGLALLDAKADKYRDVLIQEQGKYLLPKTPEPKAEVPDNTEQLRQAEEVEKYKQSIESSPVAKQLIATKKLTIGEGDEAFNYPVEKTDDFLKVLYDNDAWADGLTLKDDEGKPTTQADSTKLMLLAAIHNDHEGFLKEIAKHYKSLGGKAVVDKIDNAKEKDENTPAKSDSTPASPAAAMAKSGQLVG